MAKMMKPELKVVRFGCEDVIATSGGVAAPGGITSAAKLAGWWGNAACAVLASEVTQYDNGWYTGTYSWYLVTINEYGEATSIYNAADCAENTEGDYYAWYHNNEWQYSADKPYWGDWNDNFFTGDGYVSATAYRP